MAAFCFAMAATRKALRKISSLLDCSDGRNDGGVGTGVRAMRSGVPAGEAVGICWNEGDRAKTKTVECCMHILAHTDS